MTRDGFITNPRLGQPGCLITPRRLIEQAEALATPGSGQHYELFHARVVDQLRGWCDALANPDDREALRLAAGQRGYAFDDDSLRAAAESESDLLRELQADML
ncbi:hypothetical protein [Halomonas sp. PA16-9]|jgi:hypothetical protein|uniref:hypothetical protein n=1 Tax=Halomonas sp. PA16-9 TaxID=2576841 RepID=UPI0012DA88AA|nr:hypothetical protein FDY98_25290 [Halomonas sp. PA16-9]|tara:strand:- start:602 stop:910 length:309 start_codon:yes stop_codon:yes gene_type:complete